jgi:hypothetical protein
MNQFYSHQDLLINNRFLNQTKTPDIFTSSKQIYKITKDIHSTSWLSYSGFGTAVGGTPIGGGIPGGNIPGGGRKVINAVIAAEFGGGPKGGMPGGRVNPHGGIIGGMPGRGGAIFGLIRRGGPIG